jgi:pimeloyl-ACP methyl ester carboxylesterase
MTVVRPWSALYALAVSLSLVALGEGCAGDPEGGTLASDPAALVESEDVPREVTERLRDLRHCDDHALDHVYTVHHHVRVGRDRNVHVVEMFTLRAFLGRERRGALLLPGPVSVASFYEIDVDGYRFQSDLARLGMFTFVPDYEGAGESTYPADGFSVDQDFLVGEMRTVLAAMRSLRAIPRVDVIGESIGGGIAAELCDDATRVRSCVLSSMLYREGTPFFTSVFLDPGFLGFLRSQPNGYLDVGPSLYFNIVAGTTPDVGAAILATQPGVYAVGPLLAPTNLPWFDPTEASVPGLVIVGTLDDIQTQADADDLAAAYGSHHHRHRPSARVVHIAGGGHIPRVEPAPINTQFFDAVVDFVDP